MRTTQFISFLVSMLAITNPPGTLAVFLSMTHKKTKQERQRIALVATLTVLIVLIVITFTGIPILQIFGISLPAFEITGGLIILLRGLEMLHSKENPTSKTAEELEDQRTRESIAVVPLGIPIIAGPGAMTNTIIFSREFPGFIHKIYICLGVLFISFVIGFMMYYSTYIGKMVGETGIKVVTRIMGLLLSAIAMSLVVKGLQEIFPGWT
jgi:multiple antibiotic resistance protein